tara:strand:- start:9673 stop:10767 length:1095 start_codon:yes stop_codon:yes gene_type:complete
MKTILIQIRGNGRVVSGGDINLLKQLGDMLSSDYIIKYTYGPPNNLDKYSGVVFANVDRPIENYITAKMAVKKKIPIFLYCLHHPNAGVSKYLVEMPFSLKGLIAKFSCGNVRLYENTSWFLRSVYNLVKNKKCTFGTLNKAQKFLLNFSDVVYVVNDLEKKTIEEDLKLKIRSKTVNLPHPLYFNETTIPDSLVNKMAGCILVPGRVEFRKNQLFSLGFAKEFPYEKFIVVGALSSTEKNYVTKVFKKIKTLDNVSYIPELSSSEFNWLLKNSKCMISSSWFEVTSLIELQALLYGVPVLSLAESYVSPFITENYKLFENKNIEKALLKIISSDTEYKYKFKFEYPNNHEIKKILLYSLAEVV